MTEPVLKLTGIIFPGDSPGVFIGCIKELHGVVAQGESQDAVYRDLMDGARYLVEQRGSEVQQLLRQQMETSYEASQHIGVDMERELAAAPAEAE